METGCELCLIVSPHITVTDYGYADAPSDEDRLRIEQGLADREKPHDFAIEPGTWHFEQLEYLPTEEEIAKETGPYVAEKGENPLYIRLIKENALELAVQLLWLPRQG